MIHKTGFERHLTKDTVRIPETVFEEYMDTIEYTEGTTAKTLEEFALERYTPEELIELHYLEEELGTNQDSQW